MTTEHIHTCSYSCERPECILQQRDELAARLNTIGARSFTAADMADQGAAQFRAGYAAAKAEMHAAVQEAVAWQRRYKNHDEWFNISKPTYTATVASKWSEKYEVRALYAAAPGIDLVALREIASDLSHSAKVDDYMPPQQIAFIESIRDRLLALIDASPKGALPALPDDFSESKDWRDGGYAERIEWLMDTVRSQREHIEALLDSTQEASDAR